LDPPYDSVCSPRWRLLGDTARACVASKLPRSNPKKRVGRTADDDDATVTWRWRHIPRSRQHRGPTRHLEPPSPTTLAVVCTATGTGCRYAREASPPAAVPCMVLAAVVAVATGAAERSRGATLGASATSTTTAEAEAAATEEPSLPHSFSIGVVAEVAAVDRPVALLAPVQLVPAVAS